MSVLNYRHSVNGKDLNMAALRPFRYALIPALVVFVGCGMITDKDRIKIAKMQDVDPATGETYDRYITRGELAKVIREMSDEERPMINNKGDLLRALNSYINEQIRTPLAREVAAEFEMQGKQLVTREQAMQTYFAKHTEENLAAIYNLKNPEAVGMTREELDDQKEVMDIAIDQEYNRLLGEYAVAYRASVDYKEGALELTDEDYEREFKVRKNELLAYERIAFRAIRFPVDMPNAAGLAADARTRITDAATFEQVFREFEAKTLDYVMETEIQNDPNLTKFNSFWRNAAGSKVGDILGPVYLPEYQLIGEPDATGKARLIQMPAAYLVLEILQQRDETPLTLDEAKPVIASSILIGKEVEKLRKDRGVEIYEDKLPDPNMFSRQMSDGKVQF